METNIKPRACGGGCSEGPGGRDRRSCQVRAGFCHDGDWWCCHRSCSCSMSPATVWEPGRGCTICLVCGARGSGVCVCESVVLFVSVSEYMCVCVCLGLGARPSVPPCPPSQGPPPPLSVH